MKMSADQIHKLQGAGAKVKRTKKNIPKDIPKPAPKVVPQEMKVPSPPVMQKIPDYGSELRTLISTLDKRLNNPRSPWRIIVNRARSGLAESYDVIPLKTD